MKFAIEPPAKADGLGYSPIGDPRCATSVAEISIFAVLQHDRLLLTWPCRGQVMGRCAYLRMRGPWRYNPRKDDMSYSFRGCFANNGP